MATNNVATAFNDNSDILLPLLLVLLLRRRQRQPPTPSNRQWTGQEVVDNLLNCGSSIRIHNQLRMQLDTFDQLRNWLVNNTNLTGSRYLSIEEKLLIFIYITSTSALNRQTQERFNRRPNTISRYISITITLSIIRLI
jgi:hypothetical protein